MDVYLWDAFSSEQNLKKISIIFPLSSDGKFKDRHEKEDEWEV